MARQKINRQPLTRNKERAQAGREAREAVRSGQRREEAAPSSPFERAPLTRNRQVATGGVSESKGARAMQEKRMEQGEPAPVIQPSTTPKQISPTAKLGIGLNVTQPTFTQPKADKRLTPVSGFSSAPDPVSGTNRELGQKLRQTPGLGKVYSGLDVIQKATEPAAKIAQEYYTPGAGLGAIAAAERGAAQFFAKEAPHVSRLTRNILTQGGIGGITAGGQSLASHPERGLEEARKQAAIGAASGAALPIAGALVKEAIIKPLQKYASKQAEQIIGKFLGRANQPLRRVGQPQPEAPVSAPGSVRPPIASPKVQEPDNIVTARKDLQDIDDEIKNLNTQYNQAVEDQFQLLRGQFKNREGVEQGHLIFDPVSGEVKDRYGRISSNPLWVQNFFKTYKRNPTVADMRQLAKEQVDNGYVDEQGFIPGWKESNNFDETLEALNGVRGQLSLSLDELAPKPAPPAAPAVNPEIQRLEADFQAYKDRVNESVKNGVRNRDEANREIKGRAMALAAEKRSIIQGDSLEPIEGGLTGKELEAKVKRMESNYSGKPVTVNGRNGTVTKTSFGKVGVRFDDGTESFFYPDDVKPQQAAPSPSPQAATSPVTPPTQQAKQLPLDVPQAVPRPITPPRERTPGIRSNFETQRSSGEFSAPAQQAINELDQTYRVKPNVETAEEAKRAISNVDQAEDDFFSNKYLNAGDNAKHTAVGYELMKELDAAGQYGKLAQVSAKLAEDLTKQGQGIQAARLIRRLSPEGQLQSLQRIAKNNDMEVTAQDTEDFLKAAQKNVEAGQEPTRQNTLIDVLEALEAGKKPTKEDIEAVSSLAERARKFTPEAKEKREPLVRKDRKRDKAVEALGKAAEAAQKRIEARRNIGFLPKGGSDLIDYGIILAHELAKKTVTQADYVKFIVDQWGEEFREHAGKILNIAKREIDRQPSLRAKEVKAVEDVVERWRNSTPATSADAAKIKQLADSLKKLQGKNREESEIAIQQIMNKYDKGSITDKIQAVRYMAMLGNTLTQGINATSGLAKAQLDNFIDLFGWMVDGLVSSATKRERSTAAIGMNPFEYIGGMFKNAKTGITANWKGVSPGGLVDPSEINGFAFKGKNPVSKLFQLGERSLRAVAGGADFMTYKTQFDNEIMKQARLAAKNAPNKKNAIQKFVNDPPPEAIELADEVGRRATFQQKNSLGSVAAEGVSKLGNMQGKKRIPGKIAEQGVRAVLPFIRTPLNIAQTAAQMTPAGAIQGLYGIIRAKTPAEQRIAIHNLGLGVTGSGLGALGWFLSDAGVITGSNDSGDKDLDALRDQAAKGKYRFNQDGAWRLLKSLLSGNGWEEAKSAAKYKEGDTTFDYNRLQPLTFPLAVGAGIQEGGVKKGAAEGASSLLGMSSLTGLQNLFATAPGGSATDKNVGIAKKFVEGYLKSFSPSLLAQEARREDTTQRQTPYNKGILEDIKGYQQSRTPSLGGLIPDKYSSKGLPAKVTTLGEDKKGAAGVWRNYGNPYRSDEQAFSKAASIISDLIDRTGNEKLAPSAPEKKIDLGAETVELDPKRYEKYQRDVGKEIATRVTALPKDLTDLQLTTLITNIQKNVKERQRNLIKAELRKKG